MSWCGLSVRNPVHRIRPGQAIVEFALILPMFLFIVFGAIDFGRVIYTYAQMTNGVREGARFAMIQCGKSDAVPNTKALVRQKTPGVGLSDANLGVSYSGSCLPPSNYVDVTATYQFRVIAQQILGIGSIPLEAAARVYAE